MFITTKAVWSTIEDFLRGGAPELLEGYEYFGPTAECKKGRKTQKKIAQEMLAISRKTDKVRDEERAKAEPTVKLWEGTAPGDLSTLAHAEYGSEIRNIEDVYANLAETGLRMLRRRGFGSVPGGAFASMLNRKNEEQGAAETEAYTRGLQRTEDQRTKAVNYRQGLQALYDPVRAYSATGDQNAKRAQMGSLLGDIGAGLKTVAEVASSVSGMGGLKGMWGSFTGGSKAPAPSTGGGGQSWIGPN